ncbi:MAG: hydantoinase/oxoprolinase family protein [Treponema sp.]|jgi:N-methylhydantoinase A/oxoprolinase/acetone carboxylase beta subunit|nr:hydantoinase/oxoprolinase family protein [Treponema sp.]
MKYRLGIDVGGTNTDAVIIDEYDAIIAEHKTATTPDISMGVEDVIGKILADSQVSPLDIKHVMLGTTHATNAIIERKNLSRVGVIRISGPSGHGIPPFTAWPEDLSHVVSAGYSIVQGGYEYDGTPLALFDENEFYSAASKVLDNGAEALVLSCAFSPVNNEAERRAYEILQEMTANNFPITLSHEIGSIGLLERENAAILNAAISTLTGQAYGLFNKSIKNNGIIAELFIAQNDGTLMSVEYAKKYPVLTIASGPTNSLRGAAFLSGIKDAVVVDIGGTTTDIGVLRNGFPRESNTTIDLCGVRTNFRMPDLISIGLGGGSVVNTNTDPIQIGPQSVGFHIISKALIFGGSTITATDIAVKNGFIDLGSQTGKDFKFLSSTDARQAGSVIRRMIENGIDSIKTSAEDIPVILVGGGSIILQKELRGASKVITPEHFGVANAIGAAIAQVSGNIDGIFDVTQKGREKVIEEIKEKAAAEAVKAGAERHSVTIVEIDEIPLAYLPSNAVRFRVKAVGDLKHH